MDAEMQRTSLGSKNALIELAKEELEILEFQHPNKFHSLKQELKALISDFENQKLLLNSPSAATQGDNFSLFFSSS
ncbi:hypothetical protein CDL12_11683 [Handroanthus impetiginosus]|uniref:Uncharacterized protein n=1 Tax=Handroanthus impetiginosus TaxID=429701 RepID=A0A2G9HDY4_9LAMI|nr:hypothetical protein CDL12_11683 [Handroanthus impetiginosus]